MNAATQARRIFFSRALFFTLRMLSHACFHEEDDGSFSLADKGPERGGFVQVAVGDTDLPSPSL